MEIELTKWNYNQNSIFRSTLSSWSICGSGAFLFFGSFGACILSIISFRLFFRKQIIITQIKQTEIPPKTIPMIENMYNLLFFSLYERFTWKIFDLEKTFVFVNLFEDEKEQDGEKTVDFVNGSDALNDFELVNSFVWENLPDGVNGFDSLNELDSVNIWDLVNDSESLKAFDEENCSVLVKNIEFVNIFDSVKGLDLVKYFDSEYDKDPVNKFE